MGISAIGKRGSGPSLWRTRSQKCSRLHHCGFIDSCIGNWRHNGDIQHCLCGDAAAIAVQGFRETGKYLHRQLHVPQFTLGQSIPNLNDIKARAKSLEMLATYQRTSLTLTGAGEPEQISAAAVSSNFLDPFSVHPILGRAFLPADEQEKNGNVVLLGYRLWQERFGSDPQIVGKSIHLDQTPYTVVGVLPQGISGFYLRGYGKADVIVPLVVPPDKANNRTGWMYLAIAKLRPGVSVAKAQAEMDGIAGALSREYPKEASQIKFPVETLRDTNLGGDQRELMILLAAVGFLLLI